MDLQWIDLCAQISVTAYEDQADKWTKESMLAISEKWGGGGKGREVRDAKWVNVEIYYQKGVNVESPGVKFKRMKFLSYLFFLPNYKEYLSGNNH